MTKWILEKFERYVNFEFYKPHVQDKHLGIMFERYVNFEFYKPQNISTQLKVCLRDM